MVVASAQLHHPRWNGHTRPLPRLLVGQFSFETFTSRSLCLLLRDNFFRIGLMWGAIALALAVLVAWSRLFLRRHTRIELIVGTVLGLMGGFVAGWW